MSLDASLVARQIGVSAEYKNTAAGSAQNLPQRVYMIAQAESGVTFSTTKFSALTAAAVGQVAGYRSPAYLMARELLPLNNDGLSTVPLTVALIAEAAGATAAAGDITPSGTATSAGTYRFNCNEVLSDSFVIPSGAVSVTNTCRAIGNAINGKLGMPCTATYTYGTLVSAPGAGNTGNYTITVLTSTGNPKPGAWVLTATAPTVFTLVDPDGVIVSKTVTFGAQVQGGLGFTLTAGVTPAVAGDNSTITAPATKVIVTSGWKATSANYLSMRIDGPSVGVTFAYAAFAGGAGAPSVSGALTQIGSIYESMLLNGNDAEDSTALGAYQTWGEGRWDPTVKKPAMVFTGQRATSVAEAIFLTDARKTDRINSLIPTNGSRNLPFVVAARALARIARMANNIPSHDFSLQMLDGLVPGLDSVHWDLTARDQAVKGGSSTIEVIDGVMRLSDTVTCYHPTGESPPAYRYVRDNVVLQNIVWNVDQLFSTAEWAGAALVPDDQAITEPTAKKPKMAIAALAGMLDSLALKALISDPKTAKKSIKAWIDTANPKRLNVSANVTISGTTNIVDTTLYWSFYFDAAPQV